MDGVDVQNCVAGDNNAGEWDGGGGGGWGGEGGKISMTEWESEMG